MADIGHGYGSEWHLLRYLGRHRHSLDSALLQATGASAISWLDFHFTQNEPWWDGERLGLDFISDNDLLERWRAFWPNSGTPINWDAVGRLQFEARFEWLLLEAKAHLAELKSDTHASLRGGLSQIEAALDETKRALGVPPAADWLHGYYQYCNRLGRIRGSNLHC